MKGERFIMKALLFNFIQTLVFGFVHYESNAEKICKVIAYVGVGIGCLIIIKNRNNE